MSAQLATSRDQVVTQASLELVPLLVLCVEHEFVRGAGVVLGLVGHLLRPLLQLADLLASLDEGRVGLAHLARGADALRLFARMDSVLMLCLFFGKLRSFRSDIALSK